MAPWSPADIPNRGGHTIVITGANSGLGLGPQEELLAEHGASIVMTCRDEARGAQAAAQVRALVPDGAVGGRRSRSGRSRLRDSSAFAEGSLGPRTRSLAS